MEYLVFDFGGTFIKWSIMDEAYNIKKFNKFKTPENIDDFKKAIKEVYDENLPSISGVAISMPGVINEYSGYAKSAGVITYLSKTNIPALLHTFIDLPIGVENDGKCAALSELNFGSLKGVENGVVLVFGTGLGGGIIINGKLYKGFNKGAGEFSYVCEKGTDNPYNYVGATSSVINILKNVCKKKDIPLDSLSGEDFFDLIKNKDEIAISALNEYCDEIVRIIYNLQHVLDPEVFSIGGGISAQDLFIDYLRARIDKYSEKAFMYLSKPKIVASKFRNDSNMIGALINYHINKITKEE